MEIILCSKQNVKILDLKTGRTKKILGGLIQSEEEEITCFNIFS